MHLNGNFNTQYGNSVKELVLNPKLPDDECQVDTKLTSSSTTKFPYRAVKFPFKGSKKIEWPTRFCNDIFSYRNLTHFHGWNWVGHFPIFLHFDWFPVDHVTGSQNRVGHSIFLLLLNGNFTDLYGNFIVDDDVSLVAQPTFIIIS